MESKRQISELIAKLQKCIGAERKILENSIKNHFQIAQNEKYVVSKLRMMLIKMGAAESSLHFMSTGVPSKRKKQKKGTSLGTKSNYENIVEKTRCETGRKTKRLTKEEKQLQKLRQNTNLENRRTSYNKIQNSKLLYLKAYGLVPSIICLD